MSPLHLFFPKEPELRSSIQLRRKQTGKCPGGISASLSCSGMDGNGKLMDGENVRLDHKLSESADDSAMEVSGIYF